MYDNIRSLAFGQRDGSARYHCPACFAERRNKTDKPLSITKEDGKLIWMCHHCGHRGACEITDKQVDQPKVRLPAPSERNAAINYLSSRGISSHTAMRGSIVYEEDRWMKGRAQRAIGFPYYQDGKVYAVKWRGIDEKAFIQTGAANTLWGIERIEKGKNLVICEGEIDALSLWQAGVPAVSVPNGAPMKVSDSPPKGDERKYQYLQHAEELINESPRIVLATDNDAQGEALGEELARRLGRGKCWKVRWPDGCKDANDTLRSMGSSVVKECVENAEPWPVKGLYDALHFREGVDVLYETGLVRGQSTGFREVDEIYTVMPGQLTIVTGIPSMGKSAFVDQIMVNLAKREGWRFAVCSFENEPRIHIAKLMQLYVGKPFFEGKTPRMTKDEKAHAGAWIKDHFSFLYQGDGHQSTIENIIDRLRSAVLRYGIRGAVIDPANFIDRDRDMSETDWVSDALTKLKVFLMAHDLHIWFVAHPSKQYRGDDGQYRVPGGYDISGSSHWFNKADMGMTIHRPDLHMNKSEVHIWKSRYNWIGKPGKATLMYETSTGAYFDPGDLWEPAPKPGGR